MFGKLGAPFAGVWAHLKEVGGFGRAGTGLTLGEFRVELADCSLLGRPFGPDEYRAALEGRLGVRIRLEEIPDVAQGALLGELISGGHLAEVVVEEETGNAVVLVRESLRYRPWPAYELAVFHELSHLAAGHPLRAKRRKKAERFRAPSPQIARREPPAASENAAALEAVFEAEARLRATWLVLAGTCPAAFEEEMTDRLT